MKYEVTMATMHRCYFITVHGNVHGNDGVTVTCVHSPLVVLVVYSAIFMCYTAKTDFNHRVVTLVTDKLNRHGIRV